MLTSGSFAAVGQGVLGLFFVVAGVNQFFNLGQMKAYAASKGVPVVGVVIPLVAALLAAAGAVILADPWVGVDVLTVGAAVGIVGTVGITLIMHDFWRMADQEDDLVTVDGADGSEAKVLPPMENEIFHFLKNVALIGGLLLLVP